MFFPSFAFPSFKGTTEERKMEEEKSGKTSKKRKKRKEQKMMTEQFWFESFLMKNINKQNHLYSKLKHKLPWFTLLSSALLLKSHA